MTDRTPAVGQEFEARWVVTEELVDRFAALSGDHNPIHVDTEAARSYGYPRRVAPGVLSLALLSKLIGMEVPGPGAVWVRHRIEWPAPVYVGDEIALRVTVRQYSASARLVHLAVQALKAGGTIIMRGEAEVKMAPQLSRQNAATGADHVVLVTGGSRGVGAAISRRLAADDYRVALNYLRADSAADALVSELGLQRVRAIRADIADEAEVARLVEEVTRSFERVDAVVHCATPPFPRQAAAELTRADLAPYWRTYVEGAIDLVRAVAPKMMERRFGRFVFLGTSWMFGLAPTGWASYLIAKHALYGLVRSLAVELGPHGITTNMISPSIMITDHTADLPARAKEVEAHRSPLRRLARVDDVAELAAFLLSDAGSYVNGCNLPLTGGPT